MPPPRSLDRVDARMILGLPDSPENQQWIREALAALQAADPRPDVDLGSIEQRLEALEGRPIGEMNGPPIDLSDLLRRLEALERFAVTPFAEPASPPPPPEQVIVHLDPLDPLGWQDVDSAKAALTVLVMKEAAHRCGHAVSLYEDMVALDARGDLRTRDEDIRLLQHAGWAKERQQVELARLTHNAAIRAIESVEDARRYDWRLHWPALPNAETPTTASPD